MKEKKINKSRKKLKTLFLTVMIECLVSSCLLSCNSDNKFKKVKTISYFDNNLTLSDNIDTVSTYLSKKGFSFEYNNSFSGENKGVSEYHFIGEKDSVIYWTNLYFDKKKLEGISIEFTSKYFSNEGVFLNKIRSEIKKPDIFGANFESNSIAIDTAVLSVNPLESINGKGFRLKIYYKDLHNKIPSIF
jgi:hypothetical protein